MTDDDQRPPRARIERRDARSFAITGAMTFDSVTALWRESDALFAREPALQVDLREVTHTDSAGLALLVEWLRGASRRGGRMELLNLPDQAAALADAANVKSLLMGEWRPESS